MCLVNFLKIEIFFESGALVEFVRLFNQDDCPDQQHVLETILTFATAKPNSFVDVDSLLIEKFQENLDQREKSFDKSEDHDVSSLRFSSSVFDAQRFFLSARNRSYSTNQKSFEFIEKVNR